MVLTANPSCRFPLMTGVDALSQWQEKACAQQQQWHRSAAVNCGILLDDFEVTDLGAKR
jgi:hypothetical protein